MRFLIAADLPRAAGEAVRRHGHEAVNACSIGLGSAKDSVVARSAQVPGMCLLCGDLDFADLLNYQPEQYVGIVVLHLPRTATAAYINALLENFFAQTDLIPQLPGKLAIVEHGRIRLRGAR